MTRYILKRLLQGLFTLWLMLTAVFFLTQLLMPGDYVSQFSMFMDGAARNALRAQLGLDLPIWQRYFMWLGDLARFDLGRSYTGGGPGAPVIDIIRSTAEVTLLVFITGLSLAFLIGQSLGRISAWKGRNLAMDLTSFTFIAFYAFFPPSLAFLLNAIFGKALGTFPDDPSQFIRQFVADFDTHPTNFVGPMAGGLLIAMGSVIVLEVLRKRFTRLRVPAGVYIPVVLAVWVATWAANGIFPQASRVIWWAGIPIIAFTLLTTGEMMVLMRTAMADTIHEEYIATAKAKGLKPRIVRDRHAARNALLPVISKLVISLPYLLAGLAFIEYALEWPGMGLRLFNAVSFQNMPVVQGMLVVIGVLTLASRIGLDVLYAALDPRIRYDAATT
jgi:peptide/nickel transport system permease protein